jgi:hypothetical protein
MGHEFDLVLPCKNRPGNGILLEIQLDGWKVAGPLPEPEPPAGVDFEIEGHRLTTVLIGENRRELLRLLTPFSEHLLERRRDRKLEHLQSGEQRAWGLYGFLLGLCYGTNQQGDAEASKADGAFHKPLPVGVAGFQLIVVVRDSHMVHENPTGVNLR